MLLMTTLQAGGGANTSGLFVSLVLFGYNHFFSDYLKMNI